MPGGFRNFRAWGLGCKGFRVLELRLVMFGVSLLARDCGRRRSCTTKVSSGARFPPSVGVFLNLKSWVLPPLSNRWIIFIICLYIALNRISNIDCYWGGAVPNLNPMRNIEL